MVYGSVTWQLSSPYPYYGVQFDTNAGFDAFLSYSDFSSVFTDGIVFTNSLSGSPPNNIRIDHLTIEANLENLIYIAGRICSSTMTDTHLGNCHQQPGCSMISSSGFAGATSRSPATGSVAPVLWRNV